MKKIRELAVDEDFQAFVLIKNADVRMAKNGKKFIAFTFQDTSGTIDGKFWGASEEEIQRFEAGKVVFLAGKREVYQGNPHWNRIVRHLMTKYKQEFFEFPAAKRNHHAFAGGLAYHTITMLRLGKAIVKEYPELNASLLYAGIILHDLGKVIELSGAMGTEYTLVGNLVGHLVLVDEEITKACVALKIDEAAEDVVVLRHMVLAHHGLLEYGSPVRPRIMEAEILHQIDNLDASMQMMLTSIRQKQPGEYTDRIFGMDNRSFYIPKDI